MQKDFIIEKLKERGLRITKQRMLLLDVILKNECTSCKEIYYRVSKLDEHIGPATVYRMVNVLEEIGAIDRKNMYKMFDQFTETDRKECVIEFDDNSVVEFSADKWKKVVQKGLLSYGYDVSGKKIKNMSAYKMQF